MTDSRPSFLYGTILFLTALLLYIPGITWGIPYGSGWPNTLPWSSDDIIPLGPFRDIRPLWNRSLDAYLAYPLMHHFLLAGAYAPVLISLAASGESIREFPERVSNPDPPVRRLTFIGRSITAFMGAGIIVVAYWMMGLLWGNTAGLVAALLAMLQYPMFYFSRTGNLDVPSLFWGSLALLVYTRVICKSYSVKLGILFGVFAALSAATKDQAVGSFLLLPAVMLLFHWKRMRDGAAGSRWAPLIATIVAGLATYAVASGFVFYPARYFAHVAWITGMRPDSPVHFGFPHTMAGYIGLLRHCLTLEVNSLSKPIFLAALAGIALASWKSRKPLALLLTIVSLIVFVIFPIHKAETRYLLPVGFVLACFASFPLALGLLDKRIYVRAGAWILLVAVCALPLLRGLELTHAMQNDSRYSCERWLKPRLCQGCKIGYFGPPNKLPRLRENVEFVRLAPFRGTDHSVRYTEADIDELAGMVKEKGTEWILIIPDHSSGPRHPYGTTCPNELYQRLLDGRLGYKLEAHFQTPRLMPWLRMPPLDYPSVNPPADVFIRSDLAR
jgi:hypothetical protein